MDKYIEYISDGNHNYLRINCGEERKDSYPYKMITENTIRGLLPSRIRVVDGVTFLYYEIHAKQSLYYRYEVKEIDYDALKNIFFYLCRLGEELEKYLLDFRDIVFDEKYIFQNIGTGETDFLFFPMGQDKQSFSTFMEYIVQRINHKDSKAVQISYQLYDLSRRQNMSVKGIRELFEEEEKKNFVAEKPIPDLKEKPEVFDSANEYVKEIDKIAQGESAQGQSKWNDILIPSILCITLTLMICIKLSCSLSYGQGTALIAGIVVNIGLIIAFAVHKVWKKKENCESKTDIYVNEWEEKEYHNAVEVDEQVVKAVPPVIQSEECCGETVFWEQEPENILCGLGKYEKMTIQLNHFPFSIGKLKEEVDYAIKDSSVSRLHARFYQEGKEVYLMDLNSTNGTCKNGFRIPPNEKVILEEGDEISFGKIRFCYR